MKILNLAVVGAFADGVAGALIGASTMFAVDVLLPSTAEAHDLDGRDAKVSLMNPELESAVGTPFLYLCDVPDGDADPVEVTCF